MTNSDLLVTTVTKNATVDNLTDEQYREIYEEVRGYHADADKYAISLDDFVAMIGSAFSKAIWSKYHRGLHTLSRDQRNELRAAVGLLLLPPTVAEALEEADSDAEVTRIGSDTPRRVLMIGSPKRLLIRVNDAGVRADEDDRLPPRPRKPVKRPWVTEEQVAAKAELGVEWKDVINAGLQALVISQQSKGSEEGEQHE